MTFEEWKKQTFAFIDPREERTMHEAWNAAIEAAAGVARRHADALGGEQNKALGYAGKLVEVAEDIDDDIRALAQKAE